MIENEKEKLGYKEALNKVSVIFSKINKRLNSLNDLVKTKLEDEIKDNDLVVYNEIEDSKKLEYDDDVIKMLFLENVNSEVSKLKKEILTKDKVYYHVITNLKILKRVILAKIKQEDLKTILTIDDFIYYKNRCIEKLNCFKDLIYSKIKKCDSMTSYTFEIEELNKCYLEIIDYLTYLKNLFLAEIINEERK